MINILVIEDDKTVREGIIDLLKEEKYSVAGAENGAAGLAYANEIIPDLIISDILMPGLDGYGVLAKLQENPQTASIPVIFLSALSGNTDMRPNKSMCADDFLTKPYKAQDLLNAVNTKLNKIAQYNKTIEEITDTLVYSQENVKRTPLAAVLDYSRLVADPPPAYNFEKMKKLAENIQTSGDDLLDLIQKFITHNEIHAAYVNKSKLNEIRNTVVEDIEENIKHYSKSVADKNRRGSDIIFHLSNASIKISEGYLKRIVDEVVGNAMKFSSPGTSVKVSSVVENGFYKLTVADKGVGMPSDQIKNYELPKQFERVKNFQIDPGLGLSMVKKLVHLHDGQIIIKSETGKGTEVSILLPVL